MTTVKGMAVYDAATQLRSILAKNTTNKEIEAMIKLIAPLTTSTDILLERIIIGVEVRNMDLYVSVGTKTIPRPSFVSIARDADIRVTADAKLSSYYDIAADVQHVESIVPTKAMDFLEKYSKYVIDAEVLMGPHHEAIISLRDRNDALFKRLMIPQDKGSHFLSKHTLTPLPQMKPGLEDLRVSVLVPARAGVDSVEQCNQLLNFLATICTWVAPK
jgi:hypothetical protein